MNIKQDNKCHFCPKYSEGSVVYKNKQVPVCVECGFQKGDTE